MSGLFADISDKNLRIRVKEAAEAKDFMGTFICLGMLDQKYQKLKAENAELLAADTAWDEALDANQLEHP